MSVSSTSNDKIIESGRSLQKENNLQIDSSTKNSP